MSEVIYVENGVGRAIHDAINLFTVNHGWSARWQHDVHPQMQRKQNGDEWWIKDIAQRGWVILTQDRAILDDQFERQAVIDHEAKLVAFGRAGFKRWDKLRCLTNNWDVIEKTVALSGPQAITIWVAKHEVEVF